MSTVFMTGGHADLGMVGARTLEQRFGCNLILAGRNVERVEQGAAQLRAETSVRIDVLALDLNSLASVRAGAAKCREMLQAETAKDTELHGIVSNAGVLFKGPITYSLDGY